MQALQGGFDTEDRHGEFGQLAQEDPDKFIALLRVIERRVQQLLPPADATPIVDFTYGSP